MHELSIASHLVDLVEQRLDEIVSGQTASEHDVPSREQVEGAKPERVRSLHLEIGALSCVHRDALQYSFELVAQGTRLEGASLQIETVPVKIYCSQCQAIVELLSIQSLCCPNCRTPSADIRSGRELDLVAIELD